MPDSTNPEWTKSSRPTRYKQTAVWLGLGWVLAIGLFALAKAAAPDGRERADIAQFLGRFHPVMVHLPIGLILLVPVLEVLAHKARLREEGRHWRNAAGLVLGLATAAALVVALDGWLLAWSGGYKGKLVIDHMWGGIAFATACLVCCMIRWSAISERAGPDRVGAANNPGAGAATEPVAQPARSEIALHLRLYACSLVAALGVMAWASHLGGSLSHGDNFLTEYLPSPLKTLLHLAPAKAAAAPAVATGVPTVYAKQIQPIFDHSCVSCHGPQKVKGGFRQDTYANLMKGGDNGPEVVPWQPDKSELLRRVKLDPDDDDFMPNNGKNVLTNEQKSLIEKWIAAGASDRQPLLDR